LGGGGIVRDLIYYGVAGQFYGEWLLVFAVERGVRRDGGECPERGRV
jgi:hypothetical protein